MSDKTADAIRMRREQIGREIERLSAEDGELAIAEQVLRRIGGMIGNSNALLPKNASAREPGQRPRSQREFVISALRESKTPWLRSREVVDAIKKTWNTEIPEKSLRPLLSFMKRDGVIVRQGRLIALHERVVGQRLAIERQSRRR